MFILGVQLEGEQKSFTKNFYIQRIYELKVMFSRTFLSITVLKVRPQRLHIMCFKLMNFFQDPKKMKAKMKFQICLQAPHIGLSGKRKVKSSAEIAGR